MVIYEVNADVDEAVAEAYETWLQEHIREMLALSGFERAVVYVPEGGEPGRRLWTVHYYVSTRTQLEDYFGRHAERMRREGTSRFGKHLATSRRILKKAQGDGNSEGTPLIE